MSDTQGQLPVSRGSDTERTITIVVYGLFLAALLSYGLAGVIGVIIAYVKRDDVRGTLWESHFENQIQAFWAWFLLCIVGFCTMWILGFGVLVFIAAFVYFLYRTIRGLLLALEYKPYV